MYSYLLIASLFFNSLRLVRSHGFVSEVTVGGQTYPGWNPFVDPYGTAPARVVRKVLNDGFVEGTDPDINCHHEGNAGTAAIATAPAGSQIKFQWAYWPGEHQGPVSTFMTSCGDDCSTFQANTARWFKVDYQGYDPATKQWAAARLMAAGNSWTSTIPAALAPGKYLIRHEIVALHSTTPQFYPSCTQIEVTGGGSGVPSQDELVNLQDMYRTAVFPNIYGENVSFNIPGPAPVSFSGGGSPAPPPANPNPPANTSVPPPAAPTAPPAQPSTKPPPPAQQCGLNARSRVHRRRRSLPH